MARLFFLGTVSFVFMLSSMSAFAQNLFIATGTTSQQVTTDPAGLDLEGTCLTTFRVVNNGGGLSYNVQCFNVIGTTQSHIHLGDLHNTGPISAILFGPRDDDPTGPINGLLQKGVVTDADIKGGDTLAEVLDFMRTDGAYFHVHTAENPVGEVRGQIVAVQDDKIVDEFFLVAGSGTNQVLDAVVSDVKCLASFRVLEADVKVKYRLKCWNLARATQAHIHLGRGTENGPVAAFLFGPVDAESETNGTLKKGNLTDADVVAEGMTLATILDAMRTDGAYVNVHTGGNPEGEVRGQIALVGTAAGF